ncbi:MAG: glycosyltransferase, partial [Pseudomonadota bacterium]
MQDIEVALQARAGFALATLNLDHIVKLRRDAAFRAAYLAQTHVVADGNPIV